MHRKQYYGYVLNLENLDGLTKLLVAPQDLYNEVVNLNNGESCLVLTLYLTRLKGCSVSSTCRYVYLLYEEICTCFSFILLRTVSYNPITEKMLWLK